MGIPAQGDERLDPGCQTGLYIGLAEIAGIGQQGTGLAQLLGQGACLGQHRLKLLLIVRGLRHVAGNHQEAAFRHSGLRIVALLEAAA